MRNKVGQCAALELVAAMIVMAIMGLGLLDLGTIVVISSLGDSVAKNAARAAAAQADPQLALAEAQLRVAAVKPSPLVSSISLDNFTHSRRMTSARVGVQCKLPFPLPWLTTVALQTQATEPVVAAVD